MNLQVGIVDGHPGWEHLLQQEGVPYARIEDLPPVTEAALLVAGDQVEPTQAKFLRQFLRDGGSVLCSTRAFALMMRVPYSGDYVQYLDADSDPDLREAGMVEIRSSCQILNGANILPGNSGNPTGWRGTVDRGTVIVLPFDPAQLILDGSSVTKSFYSSEARLPFEQVATVDKRGVRTLVAAAVRQLFQVRGLPYCHLWHHPRSERSVFTFRIDTDGGSRSQVERLDRLSRSHQIPFTWFVDVRSQQGHFDLYRGLKGHEVGVHCFEHRLYDGEADGEKDLRTALMVFELSGIDPAGVAAPYGQWNVAVGDAIRACRFAYSSEFGYAYDDLPSFPMLATGRTSALQLPVHPISIGSLRRQGYRAEAIMDYFNRVVGEKLARRDPVLLFHHPRDGHEEVLASMFASVRRSGIPVMRMQEYAAWWRRRLHAIPAITWEQGSLRLQTPSVAEDVFLRIVDPGGREAFSPLMPEIGMAELQWHPSPVPPVMPADRRRVHEFNYRIPLTRGLDAVLGFIARTAERLRPARQSVTTNETTV